MVHMVLYIKFMKESWGFRLTLDFVLETLATVTGVASSFAMIPQVYRIFKRKSASGNKCRSIRVSKMDRYRG